MAAHRVAASWVVPGAADPAVADRTVTVVDGRIAERWAIRDDMGMLRQHGALDPEALT